MLRAIFQPIHYVPVDYYRFTPEGLVLLFEKNHFRVDVCENTHSVFHVIGWMMEDMVKNSNIAIKTMLVPLAVIVRYLSVAKSTVNISTYPSVVTITATKIDKI